MYMNNAKLLVQNPLEEQDLKSATKDIKDSIQFLQENAALTPRPVVQKSSATPFTLFAVLIALISTCTIIGTFFWKNRS